MVYISIFKMVGKNCTSSVLISFANSILVAFWPQCVFSCFSTNFYYSVVPEKLFEKKKNEIYKNVIRDSQHESNLRTRPLASMHFIDTAISVIHRERQVFREVLWWFLVSI